MKVYSGIHNGQDTIVYAGTQKSLIEKLNTTRYQIAGYISETGHKKFIEQAIKNPGIVFVVRSRYDKIIKETIYDYMQWDEFISLSPEKKKKWLKWEIKRDE